MRALHFDTRRIRSLRQKWTAETNIDRLTFRAFNQEFPTFPLLLGTDPLNGVKLHLDRTAMIPSLFKKFSRTPFVKAYEAFYEQVADRANDRAIGLVFPRKGIRHGLIIYSGDFELEIPHSLLWTYVGGTKKKTFRVYVRPFQQLAEAIHAKGHGWRPN